MGLPFAINGQSTKRDQPNVVFILTDDQGWGDLSLHGNPWLKTPHIDQFAAEGAQFDRFFVSPLCAPSRASFLTGRYHLRTGTATVTGGLETMRSEELTLAEAFKQNGYRTGCFGKWHNGEHYPEHPNGQGFDEFFGFCGGHWNKYFDALLERNGQPVKTKGYITDVLTNEALAFIEKNKDQPFFCYIPFNAPHGPFIVPDAYFNKYASQGLDNRTASVYGMCENIDDNVGKILERLKSLKLADNTIVIFSTDNGPAGKRFNGDMKGTKGSVHEGGVRVPFFIRWPGHITPNSKVSQLAGHIDVFPTLVGMCGLNVTGNLPLDGVSLVPYLQQQSLPERQLYTHVYKGNKLKSAPGAVRSSQYRFIHADAGDSLYDMIRDPSQKKDISKASPDLLKSFRISYDQWFADVTKKGIGRPPISTGFPEAYTIVLPATEAYFNHSIQYKGKNGFAHDWLINWKSTTDSIWWELHSVKETEYLVTLFYTCPREDIGATIKAGIPGTAITASVTHAFDPPLDDFSQERAAREGQPDKQWASLPIGKMKLPAGQYRLYLQAPEVKGKQVAEVQAVVLKRVN